MPRKVLFGLGIAACGLLFGLFVFWPVFRSPRAPLPEPHATQAGATGVSALATGGAGQELSGQAQDRFDYLVGRLNQEARALDLLRERVAELETQLAGLREKEVAPAADASGGAAEDQAQEVVVPEAPDMATKLVAAGVGPSQAEFITRFLGDIEMEQLYLRDRATREGWLNSPRYRQELGVLTDRQNSLEHEIGEADYDRYLFAAGGPNRVTVHDVIEGSPARAAGVQAGDLVLCYAGGRVFGVNELKQATTQGESGELVAVEVLRNGQLLEFYLPRGPLGVRLGAASLQP